MKATTTKEKKREYNHRAYHSEAGKLWREANADRLRAAARAYYHRNRPKQRETNRRYCIDRPFRDLKRRYGLTVDEYHRMLIEQSGRCDVCRQPLGVGEKTPGKGKANITVDHDHASGKVRGLLCHMCNSLIGIARDDPAILRAAAEYLECYHDRSSDSLSA